MSMINKLLLFLIIRLLIILK